MRQNPEEAPAEKLQTQRPGGAWKRLQLGILVTALLALTVYAAAMARFELLAEWAMRGQSQGLGAAARAMMPGLQT